MSFFCFVLLFQNTHIAYGTPLSFIYGGYRKLFPLTIMWPEREDDKLSPSNAEIRNKQSCISPSRVRRHPKKGQLYLKVCKKDVLEDAALNMEASDRKCNISRANTHINFRVRANAFPDCLQVFLWAYSD
jgi:hypothetical protein